MVLIAVTGPRYSGKQTVATLLERFSLKRLCFISFLNIFSQKRNKKVETEDLCDSFTEALHTDSEDSSENSSSGDKKTLSYQDTQFQNYDLDPETLDAIRSLDRYILHHWNENFVLTGLNHPAALSILRKRPFVVVFSVNALFKIRLERFLEHNQRTVENREDAINRFLQIDSELSCMIDAAIPHVHKSALMSSIEVSNNGTIQQLEEKLSSFNFLDPELLRPSWDFYFMKMAFLASSRSNCLKRRVGAIVVRENRVVSTGYNGTPSTMKNCNEGGCIRCTNPIVTEGQHLDSCVCIHAETNALLEAGRAGCYGSSLYVTCTPCLSCCKHIIQVGIKQVIYGTTYGERFGAKDFLNSSTVELRCLFENADGFFDVMMSMFP